MVRIMVRIALFVFISILMSACMTEAIRTLDSCASSALGQVISKKIGRTEIHV